MILVSVFIACHWVEPGLIPENQTLDGPAEGLNAAEHLIFLAGDKAFNEEVFTSSTGLGPLFVATSCGSCHAGDGKGTPFTTLTRFGQYDESGNQFLDRGGPQLQHRALPGYSPEALPAGSTFSKFTPPANTGLGYLELVSDADILAMADPDDKNGDGISGVPNWKMLPAYITPMPGALSKNNQYIHRFGKKASAYNLLHQTVNAYNQDMGITSTYEPKDTYTGMEMDPEVDNQTVQQVVFYLQTLKAPIPRANADNVVKGQTLFQQINCSGCHQPQLRTGPSTIKALSHKTFYPYTDLLLHDMGPALDDGYTEGSAQTKEWRTAPLWGLGLSPFSQGGTYYLLHDGRAKTIEEAILLHGGEAEKSKLAYVQLSSEDKKAVLQFLESL